MIFDNNSTMLGAADIPMAEGYDFQTGTARALIESAQNDYAMFKAMLAVDSRECQIRQESAGYVTEGELMSLSEAAAGGIWSKIVALFKKLIAKIKSIFSNFIARLTGLVAKDKTLVKKYKKQILAKGSAIDNMEVKFSYVNKDPLTTEVSITAGKIEDIAKKWNSDRDKMVEAFLGKDDINDWKEDYHKSFFKYQEPDKLSKFDLNGASLVHYLETYDSRSKKIKDNLNKLTKSINSLINDAEKNMNDKADAVSHEDPNTTTEVDKANKAYQAAVVYQECEQIKSKALLDEIAFDYKQHKAAFMKAVTVNPDKLKEDAIYYDAVAEAAAQEVEDVISGAISKEELSDFNAASKNILDSDASDDPYANEYDKVSYYSTSPDYSVSGSIDTNINSRKESYDFGAPLY